MPLIDDSLRAELRNRLAEMDKPVKLVVFTQELECQYCKDNHGLMEELAELTDKISVELYNYQLDNEKVREYGIEMIPATAIVGEKDYGIRFYGIPAGYEFSSLLEDILDVSRGRPEVDGEIEKKLSELTKPVHVKVFVTPTCPYCPGAVRAAHKMAMLSDLVKADMIEVSEFPQLAVKYQVRGVPKSVVNETIEWVGAVPEEMVVAHILEANDQD